jgi:hypothetical protein
VTGAVDPRFGRARRHAHCDRHLVDRQVKVKVHKECLAILPGEARHRALEIEVLDGWLGGFSPLKHVW